MIERARALYHVDQKIENCLCRIEGGMVRISARAKDRFIWNSISGRFPTDRPMPARLKNHLRILGSKLVATAAFGAGLSGLAG